MADYIKKCKTYHQYKNYETQNVPYETTPIPERCFVEVSLDVMGPLPVTSSGMKDILVIWDRLSRWISFLPMSNTSAGTITRLFLKEWVCIYSALTEILTDRGRNSVSQYFQGLAQLIDTRPINTVAYKSLANGINKRYHEKLHFFLFTIMQDASWQFLMLQSEEEPEAIQNKKYLSDL